LDDALKRLLAAEDTATELVARAQADSERLVQSALTEAQQQEQRFEARIPEIHSAFVDKADQRAEQTVAEMDRRFQERLTQLRGAAESHEDEALAAAFDVLLHGPGAART
jgi:V/A-type H+-transporting ATPase subunit G/H